MEGALFFCDVCGVGETSYGSWLGHVTTEGHQEGLGLLGGEVEEELRSGGVRERVVIVHDVPVWVPLLEVAHFFSMWGQLRNVIYRGANQSDSSRMRIVLVFDTEGGVDNVMHSGQVVMKGSVLDVERLFVPFYGAAEGLQYKDPPVTPVLDDFGRYEGEESSFSGSSSGIYQRLMDIPVDLYDGRRVVEMQQQEDSFYSGGTHESSPVGFSPGGYNKRNKRSRGGFLQEVEMVKQVESLIPSRSGRVNDVERSRRPPVVAFVPQEISVKSASASPMITNVSEEAVEVADAPGRTEEYLKMTCQVAEDIEDLKLEEQVDNFTQLVSLTDAQRSKRTVIRCDLASFLRKRFANCAVHLVGNDAFDAATHLDELILSIDPFGKMSEETFAEDGVIPSCQPKLLEEVLDILKKKQYQLDFCLDVELKKYPWIFSSEVSKISFVHRSTGTKCVLLLENFLIVQQTRLFKFLASLDLRVQPLMSLVRTFGSVFGPLRTTTEPFPDHSILWMLLCFLTSKKIIPPVLHLQSHSYTPLILDNTNVSFCSAVENMEFTLPPVIQDNSIRAYSVLSLLQEFFEFYGTADLSRNVICPAIGKFVPVAAFGKKIGPQFPSELKTRYLFHEDGTPRKNRFYAGSPLGLQDPFDLTTNLTKDVTLEGVERFQELCRRAGDKLSSILTSGHGHVADIFTLKLMEGDSGQVVSKRKRPIPTEDESESEEDLVKEEVPKVPPVERKEDSSWELDTEEDEGKDEMISFPEIRKCRVRMNQTLRRYFENAMSRILPQLLEDATRDGIVGDVLDELVSAVEESVESEANDNQTPANGFLESPGNTQNSGNDYEDSGYKVIEENEVKKVLEDDEGFIFVIKKKNLSQLPPESSDDEESESEDDEGEKRHALYVSTRRKFQSLWTEFLKEFNGIFWTECFGFELETPPDEDWTLPEFARVDKKEMSLKTRWEEIPDLKGSCSLHFRCVAPEEVSDILYKKKVWKQKFLSAHLKSLWTIVSGKADAEPHEYDEHIESVRLKTFVPFERRLEFSGSLDVTFDMREEIPEKARLGTSATIRLIDESYGMTGKLLRAKKLRFLTVVYERLAMKYVNVRMKQWVASCSDLNAERYNAAFKKDRKKRKGHPKWRKFRRKWKALGMV